MIARRSTAVALATAALLGAQASRAQVKISSLPAASTLTGSELVPIVQGGANVVTTPLAIKTYSGGGGGSPGGASGQLQYNNAGAFGGFTLAGDCMLSPPTISCTRTGGTSFGPLATALGLPSPSVSTLGGIESLAALPHQWINQISTSGVPSAIQPACGDLSDATLCNVSPANGVTLGNLAQIGANTVLGNGTGSTGNVAALATTGSGSVVEATSPTLTTPALGAATATSINGDAFTVGTYTLTGGSGKTLQFDNTLELAGTDSTKMTFPTSSATLARTDAGQTFSGATTFNNTVTFNQGVLLGSSSNFTVNSIKLLSNTAATACTVSGVSVCTVTKSAGSASVKYTLTTGTPSASTVALALPLATDGYVCDGVDITQGLRLQETTDSATAPVLTAYTPAGAATNFTAGDVLLIKCTGY